HFAAFSTSWVNAPQHWHIAMPSGEGGNHPISFCAKTRFWKAFVDENALRVTSGSNYLTEYQFGSGTIVHFFCRTCGVKPFGRGETADMGVFYAINIACLDDLMPDELLNAPVEYQDGRHDHWERQPAEIRHL
ncbi:hypothetical protein FHS21_001464, partial [Phyllobacterium trifolii]